MIAEEYDSDKEAYEFTKGVFDKMRMGDYNLK